MKKYLPKQILFVYLLLCSAQFGWAQRVSPIRITESNAAQYRDSLRFKIFGSSTLPLDLMPDDVFTNVNVTDENTTLPYGSIKFPLGNLDSMDRFLITVDADENYFPAKVQAYLFHPHNSNGKLFIYHSGHCSGVAAFEDIVINGNGVAPGLVIPALIAAGYTVLAVPMINYKNIPPPGYVCGYNGHDDLFTENHYDHPLRFFFNPLIACLNKLGRSNYSAIYMCGLSGGGWTSAVYPAIDTSVSVSLPVAGSWPMAVRYLFYPPLGDYEQTYPPIFSALMDYHEIYTLACIAPSRKMLQINNRYDPCCFAGTNAHVYYVDSVANALKGTGGLFKFYLDETGTQHAITPKALDVMLSFINNDTATLISPPLDSVTNGTLYVYNIGANFSTEPVVLPGLKYSLLKAPAWLTLNSVTGLLRGSVPQETLLAYPDTISFKVEDTKGRFVVYNYKLNRERQTSYCFTNDADNSVVYFLPPYLNSLTSVDPAIATAFHFNNPSLTVTGISIENNSFLKLQLNQAVTETDKVSYDGNAEVHAIKYSNGLKLKNSGLLEIHMNAVKTNLAVSGMIRFNTETLKFEYFNGVSWVNMNQ